MSQCDDYPCCGHTDGDGCQPLESHSADYWRANPHLSCQHEIGVCELDEWDDEDDEDELSSVAKDAAIRGHDFHKHMHQHNPDWPADGAGTGYAEFHGLDSA